MEVFLHNPWLTYGIGLHRLREAGLVWGLIDDLDERPLTQDEIYQFCKMLFLGDGSAFQLRHPRTNWTSFMLDLTEILRNQNPVYNPVSKKTTSWINLSKLNDIYRDGGPAAAPAQQQFQRLGAHGTSLAGTSLPSVSPNNALSLRQILQRWSHQPPSYRIMYPLGHLLVTVPDLFPPNNPKVENHKYFEQWHPFSKDAFAVENAFASGGELNDLLERGMSAPACVWKLLFFSFYAHVPCKYNLSNACPCSHEEIEALFAPRQAPEGPHK